MVYTMTQRGKMVAAEGAASARTEIMARTAKLFNNGRSQAVRLPAEFRFEGKEVFIRKDEKTGDVILSRRPESWEEFFRFRDKAIKADQRAFEEFLAERKAEPPQKRASFG